MTNSPTPALIGLDWGTSSLRAHLLAADGAVLETVAEPWGIQHLPEGGFEAAFRGVAGGWLERRSGLPVIACGMVGSRQGWREVPYVECPADAARIAAGFLPCDTGRGRLLLVPGVIQRGPLPNVLRGEETQILGAIARDPALAEASLFVLPGTHSKWVLVREGRIVGFETFLTGELFAVLRDHSLLGRPAREAAAESAAASGEGIGPAAFHRGLAVARDAGAEGISGRLFTARTLYLTGELPAAATLDYLSGLLVGEEIRSAAARRGDASRPPLVLVGDAALCARYRDALEAFGVGGARLCGDTAAAGLWQLARAAGLVPDAVSTASSASASLPHD